MGFLGILVAKNWFEMIYVAFLPVGHTHDEVDSMFGVLGNHKKIAPCESPVYISLFLQV